MNKLLSQKGLIAKKNKSLNEEWFGLISVVLDLCPYSFPLIGDLDYFLDRTVLYTIGEKSIIAVCNS